MKDKIFLPVGTRFIPWNKSDGDNDWLHFYSGEAWNSAEMWNARLLFAARRLGNDTHVVAIPGRDLLTGETKKGLGMETDAIRDNDKITPTAEMVKNALRDGGNYRENERYCFHLLSLSVKLMRFGADAKFLEILFNDGSVLKIDQSEAPGRLRASVITDDDTRSLPWIS